MAMKALTLPDFLNTEKVKNRFNEVLGKKATPFTSALLNIWNGNAALQNCDARSIVGAAGLVATMDLSLSPSLGQAYIVPYRGQATVQVGVKGFIQLAHRTGKYVALHAGKVREGEIAGFDPITGEPIVGEKISDEIVGYVAYMRLVNGFEKTVYMTVAEIEAHAMKYSQSYRTDKQKKWGNSPWSTHFDAMASKTVLKKLLSTWGVLSTDMAMALQADQSVADKNSLTYVDNGGSVQEKDTIYVAEEPAFDKETGEVLEEVAASDDERD